MRKKGIRLGKLSVRKEPTSDVSGRGPWERRSIASSSEASSKVGGIWDLREARSVEDLTYTGDSHLMTIAPTGSGKGRSVIIPTLLSYQGPIVVTDPKGENYSVTARARAEMGHAIVRLDPFNVVGEGSDALNPLDILELANAELETDAQMIAKLLSFEDPGHDDFWHQSAFGLLSGVIAYIASTDAPDKEDPRTLRKLIFTLNRDDVVYNLTVILDTFGKKMPQMAYSEISAFLQRADKERSGVLSTANSYLKAFMSNKVVNTFSRSSFSLHDIVSGAPVSIYLIIPPDKLNSHKALLRVWIGTIMRAITSRRVIPEERTLFILDECAQLGTFGALETAITLCRGYGLQVWTFWQDLSQIQSLYKNQWETLVNNCSILQLFGAKNFKAASVSAEMVGLPGDDVRDLAHDEQILINDGRPMKTSKMDYLNDVDFQGRFDANPYYRK